MRPMANSKPFVLVIVIVPFLGTVLAMGLLWQQAIHWSDLALLAAMYTITAFGLTVGFHRMLTHRSFRAHPALEVILLVLGSMAVEGPPIEFAATHIKHHAQSDREGDPHSPVEGLFHAQMGWLFKDRFADPQMYCRHLLKDQQSQPVACGSAGFRRRLAQQSSRFPALSLPRAPLVAA